MKEYPKRPTTTPPYRIVNEIGASPFEEQVFSDPELHRRGKRYFFHSDGEGGMGINKDEQQYGRELWYDFYDMEVPRPEFFETARSVNPSMRWGEWNHESIRPDWKNTAHGIMEQYMQKSLLLLDDTYVQDIANKYPYYLSRHQVPRYTFLTNHVFGIVSGNIMNAYTRILDAYVGMEPKARTEKDLHATFFVNIIKNLKRIRTPDAHDATLQKPDGFAAPFLLETALQSLEEATGELNKKDKEKLKTRLFNEFYANNYGQDSEAKFLHKDIPEHQPEGYSMEKHGVFFFTEDMLNYTEQFAHIHPTPWTDAAFGSIPRHAFLIAQDPEDHSIVNAERGDVYGILLPSNWRQLAQRRVGENSSKQGENWRSFIARVREWPHLPLIDEAKRTLVKRKELSNYVSITDTKIDTFGIEPKKMIADMVQKVPELELYYQFKSNKLEQHSIAQHTEMVLLAFQKFYGELVRSDPQNFILNLQEFYHYILLHDIGKGSVLAETNSTAKQHEKTEKIMQRVLPKLGYDPEKGRLMISLMKHDWIGNYITNPIENNAEETVRKMKTEAEKLGYGGEAFASYVMTVLVLYISDALSYTGHAYTSDGLRGLNSMNDVFDIDDQERKVAFSGNTSSRLKMLDPKRTATGNPIVYYEHFQNLLNELKRHS